jgi:IS30 family transposase
MAQAVVNIAVAILKPIWIKTQIITADDDKDFAEDERNPKVSNPDVYLALSCAPWGQSSNENSIGLIRQFLP